MKAIQKGFTLIELMIVVAIVGILAAIALPAYQDYMVRAKMTEPLAKLDELKLSVAEYVASNNALPANASSAGIGSAGGTTAVTNTRYYDGIGYETDDNTYAKVAVQLNAVASNALDNAWIIMHGTVNSANGTILWDCGTTAGASAVKLLPANCRSTNTITPE